MVGEAENYLVEVTLADEVTDIAMVMLGAMVWLSLNTLCKSVAIVRCNYVTSRSDIMALGDVDSLLLILPGISPLLLS